MARLPVLIITGAPGSGKTTLLNRLLAELDGFAPGSVPAVITHRLAREFGLDTHPVDSAAGSARGGGREVMLRGEMFDFGSGCVCCSPTGDLRQHLLAVRRELVPPAGVALAEGASAQLPPPTHVLVETSGLADPAVFAQLLLTDAELRGAFVLAGVLALVDAAAAESVLGPAGPREDSPSPRAVVQRVSEQLLAADAVAIARARSPESRARAMALIEHALDGAQTRIVDDAGSIGWAQLLALGHARSALLRREGALACAPPTAGPISVSRGDGVGGGHDGAFESACLVEEGMVFAHNMQRWAERVLAIGHTPNGRSLLRVKGVLSLARAPLGSSAADGCTCDLVGVEWSTGGGNSLRARALDAALRGPARAPARPLAHALTAGMDVQPGGCKVLFVGVGLAVNELRAALWEAMVPPGYAHAAEIELDFPDAHKHALQHAADARREPAADPLERAGGEGVPFAALRLSEWLGTARDALLFWVDGAFARSPTLRRLPLRAARRRRTMPRAGTWRRAASRARRSSAAVARALSPRRHAARRIRPSTLPRVIACARTL